MFVGQVNCNRLHHKHEFCRHSSQLGHQRPTLNACKSGTIQKQEVRKRLLYFTELLHLLSILGLFYQYIKQDFCLGNCISQVRFTFVYTVGKV